MNARVLFILQMEHRESISDALSTVGFDVDDHTIANFPYVQQLLGKSPVDLPPAVVKNRTDD